MRWLLLVTLARPLLIQLLPVCYGIVNIRHQVTHVVYRSLEFWKKRSIEDTLIEDMLNHKTELLSLMQRAIGVWWGGGWIISIILSSITSSLNHKYIVC